MIHTFVDGDTAIIKSNKSGLYLVRLRPYDAEPMFNLIARNRDHLSQYGDTTSSKYPDLESVQRSILKPPQPIKVRFGIWQDMIFVGSINIMPEIPGQDVIGYWVGSEFARRGIATASVTALRAFAFSRYKSQKLMAYVHPDNRASQYVLRRNRFEPAGTSNQNGFNIYTASK